MDRPACIVLPLMLSLLACATPPSPIPDHEATRPEPNTGMAERVTRLAAQAHDNPAALVFVGDSITQSFEDGGRAVWELHFAPRGALNLGVSGDRTENVLWRLRQGHYDTLRPKVVVVMLGTNNTGHRMDAPAKIADGVAAVLREIDGRWGKPRILLLAIFPRGERADDPMRVNNAAANARLRLLADGHRIQWLDLGPRFLTADGTLTAEIMPDLLHLSPAGYSLWAEGIKSAVEQMLR